jgi:acetylornithine deacetylase/succinyl-diaminopimelate desuccinylase-like protein
VDPISLDEVGNLVGRVREGTTRSEGCLLIAAHIDTVFARGVALETRDDANLMVGPGVGDNTVSLAVLSELGAILPPTTNCPVWIAATVGEEGLGNLRGITHLLAHPPAPVSSVIALEGNYLGRVNTVGVGSRRWRVVLDGPGGHSWEEADHVSAVESAATVIVGLTEAVRVAAAQFPGRSTINVGRVSGGESINSRARSCWFEVDLRSDSAEALADLTHLVLHTVAEHATDVVSVVSDIGHRPAGSTPADHALVLEAVKAARENGRPARLTAASTDANAAYALGIPAVTLGVAVGGDTHTEREWIDLATIADGLRILVDTIVNYDSLKGSPC